MRCVLGQNGSLDINIVLSQRDPFHLADIGFEKLHCRVDLQVIVLFEVGVKGRFVGKPVLSPAEDHHRGQQQHRDADDKPAQGSGIAIVPNR